MPLIVSIQFYFTLTKLTSAYTPSFHKFPLYRGQM